VADLAAWRVQSANGRWQIGDGTGDDTACNQPVLNQRKARAGNFLVTELATNLSTYCLDLAFLSTFNHHFRPLNLLPNFLSSMSSPNTSTHGLFFFFTNMFFRRLTHSTQVSPLITSSQPSSPNEPRHIITSGALTPQKDSVRERKLSANPSQHLGLRVGSRSPTSIPSSPTSV
jgi:hypothetical protein